MKRQSILTLGVIIVILLCVNVWADITEYTIIDLGTLADRSSDA